MHNCKAKVLSVEEKLQKLHTQAQQKQSSFRKGTKDTNSGVLSPLMVTAHPSAKRQLDLLQRTCSLLAAKIFLLGSTSSFNDITFSECFPSVCSTSKLQADNIALS